jgi:hypothetical protein
MRYLVLSLRHVFEVPTGTINLANKCYCSPRGAQVTDNWRCIHARR